MLHYHGTPITPRGSLLQLAGRNFCVSFAHPSQVKVCHEIGQSVMLDNGAYSIWRAGGTLEVEAYANWARRWLDYRSTWCVIPDVIDGSEEENDDLVACWLKETNFSVEQCAPVWHMNEPITRLWRLINRWPKVCVGSSGEYAKVGDPKWCRRMDETMNEICGYGRAPCWLHMLRGLSLAGSEYPFASADSTGIAQNHAGNNTRNAPRKDIVRMATDIDGRQCQARWIPRYHSLQLIPTTTGGIQ